MINRGSYFDHHTALPSCYVRIVAPLENPKLETQSKKDHIRMCWCGLWWGKIFHDILTYLQHETENNIQGKD